ncbi:MAG: hypothetical protein ACRC7O_15405 [Fimbriiglobus sp.]
MASDDRFDDNSDDSDDRPRRRRDEADPVRGAAKARLVGLFQILLGIVSLLSVGAGVAQFGDYPAQFAAERKKIELDPSIPADQKQASLELMSTMEKAAMTGLPIIWGVAGFVSAVIVIGGVKTRGLSGRGWGYTAAWLGMIPCVSGCCFLGVPVGIWAIVTLMNPDVKAAFAERRRESTGFDDGLTD